MAAESAGASTSLLVISDRDPLWWLLSEQSFAVPVARLASSPKTGDWLLLYTTRGCYRNPGRDRGMVMGIATVTTGTALLEEPVTFRGRDFGAGFGVRIDGVCRPRNGVELSPLAGALDFLPDANTWSARMRRSLIRLSEGDAAQLAEQLEPLLHPLPGQLAAYRSACKIGITA